MKYQNFNYEQTNSKKLTYEKNKSIPAGTHLF